MPKSSRDRMENLLAGSPDDQQDTVIPAEVLAWRRLQLQLWKHEPWAWLIARDLDGRPINWTKDEKDALTPVKPFPDYEYLRRYVNLLWRALCRATETGQCEVVFIEKSRQMVATTATLRFMDWLCRFWEARSCMLSKRTETEAKQLLKDKVRFPALHLPQWIRDAQPLPPKPADRADYPKTSSQILAVAENVAEAEGRGGTASVVLVDEAARQASLAAIVAAAYPMASLIIVLTTPELGNPGAKAFRDLAEIGRAKVA